jgi:polyphosphate kinase
MIVRGLCCLRPGIPAVSDTIKVRSIVGRFLEHSRLYYFLNDGDEEIYISSADLMERNLDRRVEVMCPVKDASIRRHLRDTVLETLLNDTHRAWELQANGSYLRVRPAEGAEPINSQLQLLDWYQKNSILAD